MKVRVDPETCIGCGACINLAPEVYDWDENGKAKAKDGEVPRDEENIAREALESCPTEAISEV